MKVDGCFVRCLLKGCIGDVVFVVFCVCGYNICKILVYFRVFWVLLFYLIVVIICCERVFYR